MTQEQIQEIRYLVGEAWKGAYNPTTVYGNANVVQDTEGLSVYRSLKPGNSGHPLTDQQWWFKIIDMSSIKALYDQMVEGNNTMAENELDRVAAEQGRVSAEQSRVNAENTRIYNENQRINDETTRVRAEQDRITQENQRISQEQGRVGAEQQRVVKEQQRVSQEASRVAAETQRQLNENDRQAVAEQDHQRAESDHATYVDSLGAFDISSYHATDGVLAKYADLTAALGTGGANIPDDLRKGGMSVKFVQSSDNKYVQYRYMSSSTAVADFTNVANWQGVDDKIEIPEDITSQLTNNGARNPETGGIISSTVYSGTIRIPVKKGDVISVYGWGYQSVIAAYSADNVSAFVTSLLTKMPAGVVNTRVEITDDNIHYVIVTLANNTHPNYVNGTYAKILNPINREVSVLKQEVTGLENDVSQLDKKVLNNQFIGNGTTFSRAIIRGLIPGRKYRVILKDIAWDKPSMETLYSQFAVANWYNSVSTDIITVSYGTTIVRTYDFVVPENSDYITVGGRANAGIAVMFMIEDVTEIVTEANKMIDRTSITNDITTKLTNNGTRKPDTGTIESSTVYSGTLRIPVKKGDIISVYGWGYRSIIAAYSADSASSFVSSLLTKTTAGLVDDDIEITDENIHYVIVTLANSTHPNYVSGTYAKILNPINREVSEIKQEVTGIINGSATKRDTPKNITVLNGYKKAKQMLNIKWTPLSETIPTRLGNTNYPASVEQTSVPYSAVIETHTYVPQNVSFYTFLSAVNNPYSLLYTENVAGNYSRSAIGRTYQAQNPRDGLMGTFMGSSCSVLIGYCLGFSRVIGARQMYSMEDVFVPIYDQSAQGVELMDVLLNTGHGVLVTDIWRQRGKVVMIKTIEEAGNVIENTYTAESFNQYLSDNNYKITRYRDLYKNIEYHPSPVVAVTDEGEPEVHPTFNSDICIFKGDKCSFAEGEVIRINFFDGTYTAMEIYKDNTLIETITELDSTTHYVDVTELNLAYGKYKARMKKSDNSYSDYTYWEILECDVSYDKETSTVTVLSHNAIAKSAYYVKITGSLLQGLDLDNISDDSFVFEPSFDVSSLTEQVYLIVEFFGEYGGVICSYINTELF